MQDTNMKKLLILGFALATVLPSQAQTFGPNAVGTAVVGGILGGVIGHNSGHRTAEGVAIGAASGFVLGTIADSRYRQPMAYPAAYYSAPVVTRSYPVAGYPYHHHHYYPRPVFVPAVGSTPAASCATVPVQPATVVPTPAQTVIINNYYGTTR